MIQQCVKVFMMRLVMMSIWLLPGMYSLTSRISRYVVFNASLWSRETTGVSYGEFNVNVFSLLSIIHDANSSGSS